MDVAMLAIIIQMCMGFLSLPNLGLFTQAGIGYMGVDANSNQYVTQYQSNSSLSSLTQKPSDVNVLTFGIDWIIAGWTMWLNIIGAFTLIGWALFVTFHLPMEICLFVQGWWVLIVTWAIIQWKSGRGGNYYE